MKNMKILKRGLKGYINLKNKSIVLFVMQINMCFLMFLIKKYNFLNYFVKLCNLILKKFHGF